MTEHRIRRIEQGQTKIRNVPITVTPEGFWCCPSPAVLQKTLKNHNHQSKHKVSSPLPPKASSAQRKATPLVNKRTHANSLGSKAVSDDQRCLTSDAAAASPANAPERPPKPTVDNPQWKISVGFGQPETSDLKVLLFGKEGLYVRMSVHWNILAEQSSFFADKLSPQSPVPCIEIIDCEDVEIYVETGVDVQQRNETQAD